MVEVSYDKLIDKISKSSGLGKEDIERRIEAKRAKLSGLISKEGAAQVVAAELGISFDNEKLKINELVSGMRKVHTIGKILKVSPVRSFVRNGKEGKVVNLTIADETSNIKVVLWDINHIELVEKKQLGVDNIVEISNGSMRGNEIHLGSFSDFKPSKEVLENVHTAKVFKEKPISEFKLSDSVSTRAFIVQAFEPKIFTVCPECGKRAALEGEQYLCAQHGKVSPVKRFLMNIVIDDGTETMRAVLFNDVLKQMGLDSEDLNELAIKKEEILGKEMMFTGEVRMNKFFNNSEFSVEGVEELDLNEILKNLEGK